MIAWLQTSGLLAQMSHWERLGDGLHRRSSRTPLSDMLPYLIGMVVIGLGIAMVVAIVRRNDMSQSCNDSGKLFRELSRAHGLNFFNQRLLRRLAAGVGLECATEVFLTPSAFNAQTLPAQLQADAARIQALRNRLF